MQILNCITLHGEFIFLSLTQYQIENFAHKVRVKNIARGRNCPDVTILDSLLGLCRLSFFLNRFVFLPFFFVFLSFLFLCFLFLFILSFCLFALLSRHHVDQMSEGSEVSKVALCVKILKWRLLTD